MSVSIEWFGFAGIGLCILAYLPQVTHLIKERCSAGLSSGAYCMWGIAAMLLLSYAIIRRDPVFIALYTYQVGVITLICYYCRKFKGQFCEVHGGEP